MVCITCLKIDPVTINQYVNKKIRTCCKGKEGDEVKNKGEKELTVDEAAVSCWTDLADEGAGSSLKVTMKINRENGRLSA